MAVAAARLGGWAFDISRQEVTWSEELYEILNQQGRRTLLSLLRT